MDEHEVRTIVRDELGKIIGLLVSKAVEQKLNQAEGGGT